MDEPRIAKGYEALALDIEGHVKQYTPEGWTVPISNVMHSPMFSAEEAEALAGSFEDGSLAEKLKDRHFGIAEAIVKYFADGRHKRHISQE